MGLLDRILGRTGSSVEGEIKDPVAMDLKSAEERIEAMLVEKKKGALQRSAKPIDEILKQKEVARAVVEDLKELDFDDDIKERTYKPILTSKPVYVKGMLEGLKGIRDKRPETFEELEGFHAGVTKALKSIQAVQHKKGRYMSVAFRNEMLKLGTALNRVIDATSELEEALTPGRLAVEGAEEVMTSLNRLDDKINALHRREEEKGKSEARLRALEEKVKDKEAEILEFEDSGELRRHMEMKEALERLTRSKKEIEDTIFSLISPLQRPLRKYEKSLEGTEHKTKKRVEMIRGYQRSPTEAFANEEAGHMVLESILLGLKDAILKGEVDMDEKEKKKTLSRLERFSPEKSRGMATELIGIKERMDDIQQRLLNSKVVERREALIRERDELLSEMDQERSRDMNPQPKQNELEDLKGQVEERMENLVGSKVELVIPGFEVKDGGGQDL